MIASIALFFNMGGGEVILVVLVFLMFFGSKSIPSMARSMGRAMREFKDASQDIRREIKDGVDDIKGNATSEASPLKEIQGPIQEFKEGLDMTKDLDK